MGKARVTELKNVDVGFVSFVTEGANGQKFQIFKSKDFKETSKRKAFKSQASIKKARYTMRELIESIVRGMFTEPKTVPMRADTSSDSQADKISPKKETVTMDQILQAIMTLRDELIAAIGGGRPASQEPPPPAQPAPGTSNSISDTDVAFAKGNGTAPQTPAAAPPATPVTTSLTPAPAASASPQPDTPPAGTQPVAATQAPTTPTQTPPPPTTPQQPANELIPTAATQKASDELAALSSMVAALAKQMESLAGKVEAIAKQRSISNAIADGSEPTSRRGVQKAANSDGTPDFSNIFA